MAKVNNFPLHLYGSMSVGTAIAVICVAPDYFFSIEIPNTWHVDGL
jgi:hypothetical protein